MTLVLASAEDQLVRTHTDAAIAFLRSTTASLPFDVGLEIFNRTVGVPRRLEHAIAVRTLAELGATVPADLKLGSGVGEGLLNGLARRLRGRRDEALRVAVDRAASAARGSVREAYLSGAASVVEALRSTLPASDAVQLYLDTLGIGPDWAEQIIHESVSEAGDTG